MPDLTPRPPDRIDPHLAPHLEEGETVLWQGAPRPGTFSNPLLWILAGLLLLAGASILTGLLPAALSFATGNALLPGLALIGAGLLVAALAFARRDGTRVYAITDRRVLVVRGGNLLADVSPTQLLGLRVDRDRVLWRPPLGVGGPDETGRAELERRRPGFYGLDDPEDMRATLERWRDSFSQQGLGAAAAFVAGARGTPVSDAAAGAANSGRLTVRHPATGITLDVPSGWTTRVRSDTRGFRIGDRVILSFVVRPGPERPYGEGEDWTTLISRGGPDIGIAMLVRDRPLGLTYEQVANDKWAKAFELDTLKSTPNLVVGPFSGFSIVRQLPQGATLQVFGQVPTAVATRQAWLGDGHRHVEIIGMARLDQPDVQRAVDAAIDSLRVT